MNVIYGKGYAEVLVGTDAEDSIYGFDGNDTLDGGLGNDLLDGGGLGKSMGTDTATYAKAASAVVVSLKSGTATGGAGNDTLSHIEDLIGSQYDDILTGDDNDNALSGVDGDDTLYGGYGFDTLDGGLGDDVLDGGDGGYFNHDGGVYLTYIDTVTYANAVSSVVANLLLNMATGGAGNDTLSNIEDLIGSQYDDILTGNDNNNILSGGDGNDSLYGGGGDDYLNSSYGDDSLYGGGGDDYLNGSYGADSLYGGAGDDVYFVDRVGDVVVENADEGWDVIYASISYILPATVEVLWLTGDAAINGVGNDLNNTISGNNGNNMLDGGLGSDNLQGGEGNDTYVVNSVTDTVMEFAGGGTDLIKSAVSYDLANSNVENLTLTGKAAINGTGNGLNNILTGNKVANILNGAEGNDKLIGGLGKDNLTGGLGADKFKFNGVAETTRDIITDFSHDQRDKIDLSAIDANKLFAGNNAFSAPTVGGTFSGTFANPGELYFDQTAHILYGNNDADSTADFSIKLAGVNSLAASDFVL